MQAGKHVVAWQVAAGLNGKAKAVLATARRRTGPSPSTSTRAPPQSYVNNNGQIVTRSSAGVRRVRRSARSGSASAQRLGRVSANVNSGLGNEWVGA